ncbi:MAG: SurA N-terminal domain-containing protein [Elusimicrobia bacterium]|nr:SurA N-terminal domain-containing protein [Elusimicrobiota bacterium]
MIGYLIRYRRPIFISTVSVFLVSIFVGMGGYLFTSADRSGAVAEVGRVKIPYQDFQIQVNRILERMQEEKKDVSDTVQNQVKQEILREMIVDEILYQKAKELGIEVTDLELASEIQHTPAFQHNNVFNQGLYIQTLQYRFRMSPEQYEEWRRKALTAFKFRQLMFLTAKLSPREIQDQEQAYRKKLVEIKDKKQREELQKTLQDKERLASSLTQERAIHMINFFLKQATTGLEVKSYLEKREQGL